MSVGVSPYRTTDQPGTKNEARRPTNRIRSESRRTWSVGDSTNRHSMFASGPNSRRKIHSWTTFATGIMVIMEISDEHTYGTRHRQRQPSLYRYTRYLHLFLTSDTSIGGIDPISEARLCSPRTSVSPGGGRPPPSSPPSTGAYGPRFPRCVNRLSWRADRVGLIGSGWPGGIGQSVPIGSG